jgi:hypothetical protein
VTDFEDVGVGMKNEVSYTRVQGQPVQPVSQPGLRLEHAASTPPPVVLQQETVRTSYAEGMMASSEKDI